MTLDPAVIALTPGPPRIAPAMPQPALSPPVIDPTPIFEAFRGNYGTELLTAAVAHLGVFGRLAGGPLTAEELRAALGLEDRPAAVLFTALRGVRLAGGGRRGAARPARTGARTI